MSNDTQRADQIAHRLYSKLAIVVNHARATIEPPPTAKVDKWFNLETPDPEIFKEHTRIYRSISSAPTVPLFQLQVLLCVPELASNQVLVYSAPDSSRVCIDPTPRYIVLESWSIEFTPNHAGSQGSDDRVDVAPSTIYKHGIPLFRTIFTLLHVLPAWKLARRLRGRGGGGVGRRNGNFSIQLRVDSVDGSIRPEDILSFDNTPASLRSVLQHESHVLPPITHPMGELQVSATYLTHPTFQLDTRESLLSSRFLSEGPDFTPTLVKNQQRDSLSGSPGSLPLRTSLPRSPPRSIADRFVLPPATHTRTTSFSSQQGVKGSPSGSPRLGNIPLPVTRNLSGAGMGTSGVSDSSSSRQGAASLGSREEVSALAARVRRESLQGRSSLDGTTPGGVPIRRTPITTVNAFKSSTISSGSPSLHSPSPSLRQHSPLSTGGPSLPSRPMQSPSSSRVPPSPIGAGGTFPSSPITPFRPSPSFAPSSLGSGRSPASGEGIPASPASTGIQGSPRQQGRRYTSSFGPRAAGAAGSRDASPRGSPGSATKEIDKPPGTSYLSTHTDDDDISAFVQEIDARKPLASRREGSPAPAPASAGASPRMRERTIREESESSDHDVAPPAHARARTMSSPSPMLATESDVDERLRKMNDAFLASLQGFGSRRREPSGSPRTASGTVSERGSTPRRPLDPMAYAGDGAARRQSPLEGPRAGEVSLPSPSSDVGIPPAYVRPRLGSTGSARSGFSVASEEVLGRMDPEVGPSDERRRSGLSGLGRES
ncbi:autophagy-related protein 13-domain-containing protein [Cubamyces menziesii]|nr:autophagy-related protein 13-domain-containing protein [Cubamyces menziesii]